MTPQSRFKGIIKRTELVVLALCAAVAVSLYIVGPAFAQEYDPWQSYLDSNVAGINITVTPGACGTGTIVLQWATLSQVDGYRLARDNSDVIYTGGAPTYTDTGLAAGSTHRYYLNAFKGYTTANTAKMVTATAPGICQTSGSALTNTAPTTTAANTTTTTTNTPAVATTPAAAPTTTTTTTTAAPQARNLSGTFDPARGIVLQWSADSGATGFAVYRRSLGADFTAIGTASAPGMSYVDTQFAPGMTYEYQVRACGNGTCTTPTNTVSVALPAPPAQTTTTTGSANGTTGTAVGTQVSTTGTQTTGTATQPLTQTTVTETTTLSATPSQPSTQPAPTAVSGTSATVPTETTAAQPNREPVRTTAPVSRPVTPISVPEQPPVVVIPPTPPSPAVTAAQTVFVEKMQSIAETVAASQGAVQTARDALIASIDSHIEAVLRAGSQSGQPAEATIRTIRAQLINSIDVTFAAGSVPTAQEESRLQKSIQEGFAAIDRAAAVDPSIAAPARAALTDAIGSFADAVQRATQSLQASGAGEVYKDTNKDGISDYDSVHLYNIDPVKPSPVTVVDGKTLTAGDKVLLGYDPTAKDLVALPREEASSSYAPETTVYKVEEVKLTEEKQVSISGSALPNSYVTLYIYSTPIVVTVKTDRNGKWSYTMDRELESGEHKIYAASVDNTGKIVAKTVAIPFTKTAEAATLDSVPSLGAAAVQKPSITNNRAIYPLIALSILFIFGVLYVMGKGNPKDPLPPAPPSTPTPTTA